ncbi:MAG: bifunctional riboflavin kinase/FAD synthetase [Bacilli bacterium]
MTIYTMDVAHQPTVQGPYAVALGFFDGVHVGHQSVVRQCIQLAQERGLRSAVMTFHPHPKEVLRPGDSVDYLLSPESKLQQLKQLGVDDLFLITFSKELSEMTPQAFVDTFLIGMNVHCVIAGFDFTYGKFGRGTMESLPFHSRNTFDVYTVSPVTANDEKVSSTRIRSCLHKGEVNSVMSLLGRPHSLTGEVVKGDQRGRTIGFPTANVATQENVLIPTTGVYATRILVGGVEYPSVCNIGYKPTFHDALPRPTVEVHIFDFDADIYGEIVTVQFLDKIRDEKKFDGIAALVAQITADKQRAKELLGVQVER